MLARLASARVTNQRIEIYYRDIGYLADYANESDIPKPYYDFVISWNGEWNLPSIQGRLSKDKRKGG